MDNYEIEKALKYFYDSIEELKKENEILKKKLNKTFDNFGHQIKTVNKNVKEKGRSFSATNVDFEEF